MPIHMDVTCSTHALKYSVQSVGAELNRRATHEQRWSHYTERLVIIYYTNSYHPAYKLAKEK
jgi:uracil-DNA glycosylase